MRGMPLSLAIPTSLLTLPSGDSPLSSTSMAILEPASAIWLLDGWQDSQGSQVELVHARVLQIKVFYPQDGARLVYWWGSD